jgi:hypothetical protein
MAAMLARERIDQIDYGVTLIASLTRQAFSGQPESI